MNKFLILFLLISSTLVAQTKNKISSTKDYYKEYDSKSILTLEEHIVDGLKPWSEDITSNYSDNYRVIIWNEDLSKAEKYTVKELLKLGYEFIDNTQGDNYQYSSIFRNCDKNIILTITEWYKVKYSISIEWYSNAVKNKTYLGYCK